MQFFIKKNSTLPLLKMQIVKDGRSDYEHITNLIEKSSIVFSMVDTDTGIPKIISKNGGFVSKTFVDKNATPEYYIYYLFTKKDTNRVGRFEGQFILKNDEGDLIVPIREKLEIIVEDSITSEGTGLLTNETKQESPFYLGRQYIEDDRDKNYLIKDHLLKNNIKSTITSKYWDDNVWWGDQGPTPQCVGYAWAHWIEDGPILHKGAHPLITPKVIYENAQKLDEWPGENYDGTSVRGGVKYLQGKKLVSKYYWGYDIDTLINTVLSLGPVVVGTNWYYGMFYPNLNGLIKISGYLAGGHAYVINGVDTTRKLFRIKNSWGKRWGLSGHAFISFSDMTRLIREQGEICIATEIKT